MAKNGMWIATEQIFARRTSLCGGEGIQVIQHYKEKTASVGTPLNFSSGVIQGDEVITSSYGL
jgi:hypothetical protein